MSVETNIAARRLADELLSLVPALLADNDEHAQRFWELIVRHASRQLPKKPLSQNAPMSHEEAMAFEGEGMMFGVHLGERIGDINSNYWLAITESYFNKRLARYLKSRRFAERQGKPWDGEDESDE